MDFLAWATSKLAEKMETPGFLAPGLCLFGDNAYVNASYMATPWPAVGGGRKDDDYNFYHSQVRIKIECAFGMLVNRWGILRSALSAQISLRKVGALVMCLCRLHNYCISERLRKNGVVEVEDAGNGGVPLATARDAAEISANGGVPLEPSRRNPDLNQHSPEQLLHGGQHFDDVPRSYRRREERDNIAHAGGEERLPHSIMTDIVERKQLRPPLPNRWQ